MDVVYIYGGIAQLARVLGSYPIGRRFESHCRYQINKPYLLRWFYKRAFEPLIYGPVVKRLRHRPFTAVTRVRFSSGSPRSTCRNAGAFFFMFLFFIIRESNSIVHLSAVRHRRSRKGHIIGYLRSKSSRLALMILVRVTTKRLARASLFSFVLAEHNIVFDHQEQSSFICKNN